MKYSREGFRDRAKGTQRFARSAGRPPFQIRITSRRSQSVLLISLPLVIALLLFGQRMADIRRERESWKAGKGTIVQKERRALADSADRYVLLVEIKADDQAPLSGAADVDAEMWEAVMPGDRVEVTYRVDPRDDSLTIREVRPVPPEPADER